MLRAVLLDVDFTLFRPGPVLGAVNAMVLEVSSVELYEGAPLWPEVREWLADRGLHVKYQRWGHETFGGGEHMWSAEAVERSEILHLSGTTLRTLVQKIPALAVGLIEALRILTKLGLTARLKGSGVVTTQTPPPGTPIERGMSCELELERTFAAGASSAPVQ